MKTLFGTAYGLKELAQTAYNWPDAFKWLAANITREDIQETIEEDAKTINAYGDDPKEAAKASLLNGPVRFLYDNIFSGKQLPEVKPAKSSKAQEELVKEVKGLLPIMCGMQEGDGVAGYFIVGENVVIGMSDYQEMVDNISNMPKKYLAAAVDEGQPIDWDEYYDKEIIFFFGDKLGIDLQSIGTGISR